MNIAGRTFDADAIHWWWATTGRPAPKLAAGYNIGDIADLYIREGADEGVRGDVAFCQADKETGSWQYGNLVTPDQNNYCGLGATGPGQPGASFATPGYGIRAHVQHLCAYMGRPSSSLHHELVDPRFGVVASLIASGRRRVCESWEDLSGQWAIPGVGYGEDIVTRWQTMRAGR